MSFIIKDGLTSLLFIFSAIYAYINTSNIFWIATNSILVITSFLCHANKKESLDYWITLVDRSIILSFEYIFNYNYIKNFMIYIIGFNVIELLLTEDIYLTQIFLFLHGLYIILKKNNYIIINYLHLYIIPLLYGLTFIICKNNWCNKKRLIGHFFASITLIILSYYLELNE